MSRKKAATNLNLGKPDFGLLDYNAQSGGDCRESPLKEFTRIVRLSTGTHTCLITFVNLEEKRVYKIASSSQDIEFEKHLEKHRIVPLYTSENRRKGVHIEIARKEIDYETNTLQTDGGGVSDPDVSKRFNLNYFYCYPIRLDGNLKGYLNFFAPESKSFPEKLKQQIRIISKFAEVPIRQYEIERNHNQTLKDAIEEMAKISGDNQRDQILKVALAYSLRLLNKDNLFSSVLKLDEKTGSLLEVNAIPAAKQNLSSIAFGTGYCSEALLEETELLRNVNSPDWNKKYLPAWNNQIQSEMVVPLFIKNEQIRIRNNVVFASRPIAVLNFESRNLNEFAHEDVDLLLPLVSQASLLFEKLAVEKRISHLREIEKIVASKQNLNEVLLIIAEGIREALGFEVVNISLVDDSKKTIDSRVIIGIPEEKVERFLQMATHSLNSNDIQASIAKNKKIEVPDKNDNRLDEAIRQEFNHDDLIRVFVPVVSRLSNRCVGTIEAGYKIGFRKNIYESDVQVLQGFAELVSESLEKRNSIIMDKISHELRSPVSGILGNINRLKAHHRTWEKWFIDVKLEDIELDCEILKHNILELEYFLGRPFPKVKIGKKPSYIMKDIVLKTLKQLKPLIEDEGLFFDIDSCISKSDLDKIHIYTDKVKLGQVFYNLVANSIRYADRKTKNFKLKVFVDDETDKDYFIIKFQDWGIGVKEDYKEKIFEEYFRSPEAKAQFVSGTGLGLTISRTILRNDIKGDLILANLFNPTEFNVKIPKRYEKKPH